MLSTISHSLWCLSPPAPCAPQSVAVSLVCKDNTGSVSWTPSPGAISYKVKALSRDGDVLDCTTNTTTCDVPNMKCAQTYRITVTPFSQECQGYDSQTVSYVAGKEQWANGDLSVVLKNMPFKNKSRQDQDRVKSFMDDALVQINTRV